MNVKTLIAAVAFALPMAAFAGGDKASAGASAGSGATGNPGAEKMFVGLDKNKDGFLTKEEAKGTPHEKDFAKLDKNGDGKLTRQEHAAAPEHAGSSATGATSGGAKSSGSKY